MYMQKPDLYYKLELKTPTGYKAILINENSPIKRGRPQEKVKAKDLKINDIILNESLIVRKIPIAFPFEWIHKKNQYFEVPSFLYVISCLENEYPNEPWDLNSEFSKKLFEKSMILEATKEFLGTTFTDCLCIDYYSSGSLCKGHYINGRNMSLNELRKVDIQ